MIHRTEVTSEFLQEVGALVERAYGYCGDPSDTPTPLQVELVAMLGRLKEELNPYTDLPDLICDECNCSLREVGVRVRRKFYEVVKHHFFPAGGHRKVIVGGEGCTLLEYFCGKCDHEFNWSDNEEIMAALEEMGL